MHTYSHIHDKIDATNVETIKINIFNRGCFNSNGSSNFVLIYLMQISVTEPSNL